MVLGTSCGLAILAKGPIGLLLPATILVGFLLWRRQGRIFWNRRSLLVFLACWLAAAPWFILESIHTRGWFAKGFFITNNVHRFFQPMEDHRGPWFYHIVAILLGFAPWSVFFGPILWHSRSSLPWMQAKPADSRTAPALLLLWCWIAGYFVFFSLAATKLPNYLLPLYPALALVTAHYLQSWRRRQMADRKPVYICLGILACAGLAVAAAMKFGNRLSLNLGDSVLVAHWAWVGLLPATGAILAALFVLLERRNEAIVALVATSLALIAVIAGIIGPGLESWRAPRHLVTEAGAFQREHEIRLASYHYTRPSLAFYTQREVHQLNSEDEVQAFLQYPLPVYLFIAEPDWEQLHFKMDVPANIVARAWDIHRNCRALVISNRQPADQTSSRLFSCAK